MNQNYGKLQAFVRVDGSGMFVPGTNCYKPLNIIPKNGKWVAISANTCCGSNDSFLLIYNNTTNLITSITSADGTINLTGLSIGSGGASQYLMIDLPNGYDYVITATATTNYAGTPSIVNLFAGASPSISTSGNVSILTIPVGIQQQYLATLN